MEVLLEIVFQIVGWTFVDIVWESPAEDDGGKNYHPLIAALGYLALGAAIGAFWVWVHPGRFFSSGPISGASLVLAPLAVGAAMQAWGTYRRRNGHKTMPGANS